MTTTDQLAIEHFRTIVAEAIDKPGMDAPWKEAAPVVDRFPGARFEYFVNEHGIPMRKVVVESEATVDPNPQVRCSDKTCPDYGSADFGEGRCPASHALSAPLAGQGDHRSWAPSQRMVDAVDRALKQAEGSGDNRTLAACDAVMALYPAAEHGLGRIQEWLATYPPMPAEAVTGPDVEARIVRQLRDMINGRGQTATGDLLPCRGDAVATWLKRRRDELDGQAGGDLTAMWMALDSVLGDYRNHADTGTPLTEDVRGPYDETPEADSSPTLPHPYIPRGSDYGCLHVVRAPSGPEGTGVGRTCGHPENHPVHSSDDEHVMVCTMDVCPRFRKAPTAADCSEKPDRPGHLCRIIKSTDR